MFNTDSFPYPLTRGHTCQYSAYLGSCRQLTESGLSNGPLFCISNTLQFPAIYCQSNQGCSVVVPLSSSVRSSLRLWIRTDSGKSPPNCTITQNIWRIKGYKLAFNRTDLQNTHMYGQYLLTLCEAYLFTSTVIFKVVVRAVIVLHHIILRHVTDL